CDHQVRVDAAQAGTGLSHFRWPPPARSLSSPEEASAFPDEEVRLPRELGPGRPFVFDDDPFLHEPAVAAGIEAHAGAGEHELVDPGLRKLRDELAPDRHREDLSLALEDLAAGSPPLVPGDAPFARKGSRDPREGRAGLDRPGILRCFPYSFLHRAPLISKELGGFLHPGRSSPNPARETRP